MGPFLVQQSGYGDSLILGYKDPHYIWLDQNIGLFNIAASDLWTIGTIILLLGLILTLYASYSGEEITLLQQALFFTIGDGITLGLSAMCRFNGGFAISIGVPIILIIGWWMYRNFDEDEDEMDLENETGEVSCS